MKHLLCKHEAPRYARREAPRYASMKHLATLGVKHLLCKYEAPRYARSEVASDACSEVIYDSEVLPDGQSEVSSMAK